MNKNLKKAIVNFIIDNEREFQIINRTSDEFKEYIYSKDGEYLIGGEDVLTFIREAIELLNK